MTDKTQRDSDISSISRAANNWNIVKNMRHRFPYPYTEEKAKDWIDHVRKEDSLARAGKWTPESGSEGPAILTNYTITVNDEAVGAVGLDFGGGMIFSDPRWVWCDVLTKI